MQANESKGMHGLLFSAKFNLKRAFEIPYFNGTIFLENKSKVGKVEEIFGPIDNSVSLLISICTCNDFALSSYSQSNFAMALMQSPSN